MNSKGSAEAVCGYKCGALPSCAPLAAAFVPAQENAQAQYEPDKALARGTLFPGLDLPFGNMVNDAAPNVPLAELMAIDFAAHDLSLYLDTHAGDAEAFAAYQDLLRRAALCKALWADHQTRSSQRGNVYLAEKSLAVGIPRRHGGLTHVYL